MLQQNGVLKCPLEIVWRLRTFGTQFVQIAHQFDHVCVREILRWLLNRFSKLGTNDSPYSVREHLHGFHQ